MDLGLTGRTALVCASTSGLGEGVARALDAEGANVVVCGRRADRAKQIASELSHAVGVEADLTDPACAASLVAAAEDAFGPVEVCVLNSGGPPAGGAAGLDVGALEVAMNQLLYAHVRVVSQVLPGMRRRGWGRILGIAGRTVITPVTEVALSNIGRSAFAAYVKSLANEVGPDGVTANLLLTGTVATDRTDHLFAVTAERLGLPLDAVMARDLATIPVGRFGHAHEFGAAAAFLCSEAAANVTGTATRCDGGQVPVL